MSARRHPAARGRDGLLHGRRRLRARDVATRRVIVRGTGTIFLGGPPLVKAATGEEVTAEELGGADVHARISGVADGYAESDEHALALLRESVGTLERAALPALGAGRARGAGARPRGAVRLVPADPRRPFDVREVIARLVDGSRFHEFKPLYGDTLVCGFAHLWGYPVAILANNGILFSQSALKGAHFVQLACHRKIPLLFLQNISGFMVGREYEHGGHRQGRRQAGDRGRVRAGAQADGDRRRLVRRRQLRHVRPRLLPAPALHVAERAHLGDGRPPGRRDAADGAPRRAARARRATWPQAERAAYMQPILDKYEHEGSPYHSTARLWDDGILDPLDTRRALALGLAAATRAPVPEPSFGVFRM